MIGRIFIVPIRIYQICLAPLLGPRCRFYPSCSRYAVACLEKDPFSVAIKKICCRILKCHPWHPGGVDLP
ncbi:MULTISPECIES: membrane protein insertion efficiency factor YidD [Oligoflexus]|jgi:putative membrane protein insertion efficiency factor|uniref:membrane protein insertion efficiency factor YidD n=1 Tax=Oligoflexus TaxID=1553903 RepID=UPI000B22D604